MARIHKHSLQVYSWSQIVLFLGLFLNLISLTPTLSSPNYPPRVLVPKTATYGNFAWGFSNGGKDKQNGKSVVLVDLDETSFDRNQQLKDAGHIVQCYFSVGTAEPWRPDYNKTAWKPLALGNLPQFDDEYWLDLTKIEQIKQLMTPRFERAKLLGCDAIEPDNTDCYENNECKNPMKNRYPDADVKQLQIDYCEWQIDIAHRLGMSISLKNSMDLVSVLSNLYDFAVTEQCHQYKECNGYSAFIAQNKAVFNHEYSLGKGNKFCQQAKEVGVQTKRCNGMPARGVCKPSASWKNCFTGLSPLPPRAYTNGSGTLGPTPPRPSKAPTPVPTKKPTKVPTKFPTRKRRQG